MTQFIPATIPAIDRNGQPAPGATWNFYAENTLTATPVVGGQSTITAGSTGVFPGITLDNDVTYRSVLKTADGRVISDITSVIDRHFAAGVKEAVDGSGLVPGALWKFYDAGTTNPRPVFADPDMTVSLGASVEADANARFPEIYLNSASAYKAVLERPDGTVLGTIDPVNASTMAIFLRETNPDGTYEIGGVLYGPNYGPRGPMQIMVGVTNQGDIGYCRETDNLAEDLPAMWASRGVNVYVAGHPDSPLEGRAAQWLAATEAAGLMINAAPRWETEYGSRSDIPSLDYRDTAINDPYWRINWINYHQQDEIDLLLTSVTRWNETLDNMVLAGVSKPVWANFTRRVAVPASAEGGSAVNFYEAFNAPRIQTLSIDSYEWHLTITDTPGALATQSSPEMFTSTWNGVSIYDDTLSAPLDTATRTMFGRRFSASVTGMAVHLQRTGPVIPGRSDDGELPVQYPPIYFNVPPFAVYGTPILPQAMSYSPGDRSGGHYIATGRVDVNLTGSYPRGGQHQPGRFLRNEAWSGFVHGSSGVYNFPQAVGSFSVMGYVDAATNRLHVTQAPVNDAGSPISWNGVAKISGSMDVVLGGTFTIVGFIDSTAAQVSGTPNDEGVYVLDPTVRTSIDAGSIGTPVRLQLRPGSSAWGDDSNAENLSEFAALVDNLDRMQNHPTGGNLMIDTVQGGRRAFTVMRCPDSDADLSLYKDDMTLAPMQDGYTEAGVPIPDSGGGLPLWDFGWPMGFEGFRVVGDDGATYIYVRSMSNGDAPTWFPGYAALGLPARVFNAFELVGYRRVGSGSAVEMTGTSGVIKAGVDDGAATWFYIETASLSQNEGNSGNTDYVFTIRRGGDLTGTDTVTATVSGTGFAPAAASDFVGGVFPTEVLSFGPTETTKTFTASVIGDTTAEFNETALVTLSAPSAGCELVGSNKSVAPFTLVNDDAAIVGAFIWLVSTLTAAPSLPGAPSGATYLRPADSTYVTRAGVKMKSSSSGMTAADSAGFASVPYWLSGNVFNNVEFELAAGDWEVGFIITGQNTGGTVLMIDDPAGAANVRQTLAADGALLSLTDTDGTTYSDASTAVGNAVNNLTYVTVTVSDLGSGVGVLRIYGTGSNSLLSAIALREA